MIDVDGQHQDAMLFGIADDLRGRVKSHWLRVEQGRGERRGIMAFQPARDIDQQGKARGMAFGKAVFAETLDLVEAAMRKFGIVAARDHVADHQILMRVDHPARSKSRHGLAQLIGLCGRKLRRVDGDFHRLFLKNWNAVSPPQDRRQLVWRTVLKRGTRQTELGLRVLAHPPALLEIWMNHIALDRARPYDRHLHNQIVELARL